jgi:mRNA interferase MazF
MPNTTSFEFGDVVLVPFPFTNQSTSKKRPAVVVSSAAYVRSRPDLIVLAITSQSHVSGGIGEAAIRNWRAAGLLKPSVFKPLLATIDRQLVLRTLGKLEAEDRTVLGQCLDAILGG